MSLSPPLAPAVSGNSLRRWVDQLALKPNYKWVVVGLLFFAGFLNLEDRVVITSVMPLIRKELVISDVFVGALMTSFLWTYGLFSPFAGFFGDRLSRRRVIVGCLVLWSLVTIIAGTVTSANQLMATRILLALTEAFYIPASLAIVADFHGSTTRAKAVAILIIGMNLGPIVGGYGAGWIGDHYGWRPTLFVLGGAGVLLAIILVLFLRDAPTRVPEGGSSTPRPTVRPSSLAENLGLILHTPSLILLMLSIGIFSLGVWMLITWLPIFLFETFHMSLANSGGLGGIAITGPVFIGAMLGGALSDYVGAGNPRRRLLLLLVFYVLSMPFPLLFSNATGPAMVLSSVFLFQLCRSLGELNGHPLIFELVPADKRSTAIGVQNSLNCMFGGLGPIVVGHYKTTLGLQGIFGMVPILITFSVIGLLIAYFKFLPRDLKRAAERAVRTQAATAS